MMILRSSPASPFGRKVKMALSVLGMLDRVDVVNADTTSPSDSIRAQNPLGKIPALILEDGTAVYDSRVIVDCLDGLDGRGILVPPAQRLLVLRQQALVPAVAEQRDQGADDAKGGERLLGRVVEGIEVQQYGALMGLTTAG